MTYRFVPWIAAGAVLIGLAGCGTSPSPVPGDAPTAGATLPSAPSPSPTTAVVPAEAEHPHKPGTHGGIIVPIGADSYHAEAVVETGGTLRLLLLGRDEARVMEVDVQPLTAYVKVAGDSAAKPVKLTALRQEGDAEGKTSQFVANLPAELVGKPLDVTIPSLRIAGERFRLGFTTAAAAHAEEMPPALPADEERLLYLVPGGKYTAADIAANGRTSAGLKFRGQMASHDMKPKPGDRICPVTLTKANPKFAWVIGGNSYEFCCPPCIDEYVKLAKESPSELKGPETFVK